LFEGTIVGKTMKIVFTDDVVYAYAVEATSAAGGAERYQWLLARALAANDWSVAVGVRGAMKAGERRAIDGVEFVGIGQGQILAAWFQFLRSERTQWWYWQTADHLWGPAVEIAKLAGVRTIFSAAFDRDVRPRDALTRRRRWWPLYAWGLSRTDIIFVQHGGQLSELVPRWRSRAYILPGVVGETAAVKSHFDRAKYVAWVAMLRQPKRPDLLVEIAQKTPAIRFVVCGGPATHRSPPGYGEQIMAALHALPNVEFLGQIAPDKALQVIAEAAVLLSTSDEEGFPSTFLEAWSSGTPVVSLKIDPDHIIERAGLGAVSGDVERAIADINALMDSPQRRDEIAVRARRYVEETHSEAAVAAVFNRAIGDTRS
jgi:glycosyltransferase involved in cell wall biosynthesis